MKRVKKKRFFYENSYICSQPIAITSTIIITMTDRDIENRMIFASSCVESVSRALALSPKEAYQRMKRVNLINGYILKYYDTLHSESRKHVTEDVVGCLLEWEKHLSKESINA